MALVASTSTADMPRTSHRFPALSRVLPKHQMPPVTAGSPPSDVSVATVVPHTPVGLGRRCGTEVTVTAESDRWLVGAAPHTLHEEATNFPGAGLLRERATLCTPANMALHGRGEATAGTLSGGGGTTRWSFASLGRRRLPLLIPTTGNGSDGS